MVGMGDNEPGADNQQERLPCFMEESSETLRQTQNIEMIKSGLHGDMKSQAEMTWPSLVKSDSNTVKRS